VPRYGAKGARSRHTTKIQICLSLRGDSGVQQVSCPQRKNLSERRGLFSILGPALIWRSLECWNNWDVKSCPAEIGDGRLSTTRKPETTATSQPEPLSLANLILVPVRPEDQPSVSQPSSTPSLPLRLNTKHPTLNTSNPPLLRSAPNALTGNASPPPLRPVIINLMRLRVSRRAGIRATLVVVAALAATGFALSRHPDYHLDLIAKLGGRPSARDESFYGAPGWKGVPIGEVDGFDFEVPYEKVRAAIEAELPARGWTNQAKYPDNCTYSKDGLWAQLDKAGWDYPDAPPGVTCRFRVFKDQNLIERGLNPIRRLLHWR
jgi:hypothetical protein